MTLLEEKITERDLERGVVDVARILGYKAAHFRPAGVRGGKFVTPVAYDGKGFPDLVLVRDDPGRVIYLELKVGKNTLTPEQADWLELLRGAGQEAYVITEHDWRSGYVETLLARAA
jgi:hypothetical protein